MKINKCDVDIVLDEIRKVADYCWWNKTRQAISYLSPFYVVKMSRRFKPDEHNLSDEFVLTIGRPNYQERKFINLCQKAKEKFPVKKIQVKWYDLKGKNNGQTAR